MCINVDRCQLLFPPLSKKMPKRMLSLVKSSLGVLHGNFNNKVDLMRCPAIALHIAQVVHVVSQVSPNLVKSLQWRIVTCGDQHYCPNSTHQMTPMKIFMLLKILLIYLKVKVFQNLFKKSYYNNLFYLLVRRRSGRLRRNT